jgi:hypothetical protein
MAATSAGKRSKQHACEKRSAQRGGDPAGGTSPPAGPLTAQACAAAAEMVSNSAAVMTLESRR